MDAMDYKIPEDIKSCIPDYFYYALAGELVSIFGPNIVQPINDYYDLQTSSHGWDKAFFATCEKLNMTWLYNYLVSLDWQETDIFNGEIEEKIIRRFIENYSVGLNNPYSQYIESKKKL